MFQWLPADDPAKPPSALEVSKAYAPSGSVWDKSLDEKQVFHAKLTSPGAAWQIRVGKGGQIYSLRGPFGEAIPPQIHRGSQWNDEVLQLVAVSQTWQRYAKQSGWRYFIHGSGTYVRDPQFDRTFYCPIVAEQFDAARQTYTVMNWGQQAHVPTPFRSGVLFTTRWRVIDKMTVEVVYGVHNWGDDVLDFFNVPWGGVRATTFPVRQIANADHSRAKPALTDQVGSFPTPKQGQPMSQTGGWMLFSQDRKAASPSLGLVIGTDREPWPGARFMWRGGYAGNPARPNPRDYFVTTIILQGALNPGESFWARRYFVIGPRDAVAERCAELAESATVQRCQWNAQTAPRIDDERFAVPLHGGKPLFRLQRPGDPNPIVTHDPYHFAGKQPVVNPLAAHDPRFADYQRMQLLRPYIDSDGMTWQFLGFTLPDDAR